MSKDKDTVQFIERSKEDQKLIETILAQNDRVLQMNELLMHVIGSPRMLFTTMPEKKT